MTIIYIYNIIYIYISYIIYIYHIIYIYIEHKNTSSSKCRKMTLDVFNFQQRCLYIAVTTDAIRGEYKPFLRLVTAFVPTKIGAQILLDQLKI